MHATEVAKDVIAMKFKRGLTTWLVTSDGATGRLTAAPAGAYATGHGFGRDVGPTEV